MLDCFRECVFQSSNQLLGLPVVMFNEKSDAPFHYMLYLNVC